MTRRIALLTAVALVVSATAFGLQKPTRTQKQDGSPSKANLATARAQYFAAQAALYSALADAEALDQILDMTDDPDIDLARTLISTINRSIQGTSTSTVKMGQAVPSVEKEAKLKTVRSELDDAVKASDEAHTAADGHGPIGPHAKNLQAHLLNAMVALSELAESVDAKPLRPPGSRAFAEARAKQSEQSKGAK